MYNPLEGYTEEQIKERLVEITKYFNRESIYNQLAVSKKFLLPHKPKLQFELAVGVGSFYDGQRIVIGLPKYMIFSSFSEIFSCLKALLGHECEHGNSSDLIVLERYLNEVTSDLYIRRGLNKQLGEKVAHYIANSIEDGRIEKRLVNRLRGYLKHIKYFRGMWWKYQPVQGEDELSDFLFAICTIATTGLYPKDWTDHYKGSRAEENIEKVRNLIMKGINVQTQQGCCNICKELIAEIEDYIMELLQDQNLMANLMQMMIEQDYNTNESNQSSAPSSSSTSTHFRPEKKNQKQEQNQQNSQENSTSQSSQSQESNKSNDKEEGEGQGAGASNGQDNDKNSTLNEKDENNKGTSSNNSQNNKDEDETQNLNSGSGSEEENGETAKGEDDNSSSGSGYENEEDDKDENPTSIGNGECKENQDNKEESDNSSSNTEDESEDDEVNPSNLNDDEEEVENSDKEANQSTNNQSDNGEEDSEEEGENRDNISNSQNDGESDNQSEDKNGEGEGDNSQESDSENQSSNSKSNQGNENSENSKNSEDQDSQYGKREDNYRDYTTDGDLVEQELDQIRDEAIEEAQRALTTAKKEDEAEAKRQAQKDAEEKASSITEAELEEIIKNYKEDHVPSFRQKKFQNSTGKPLPTEIVREAKKLKKEIEEIFLNKKTFTSRHQKRGMLDTNALWQFGVKDYNVFQKKNNPTDTNYVFYILKDGSGSMMERVDGTATKWFYACKASAVLEEAIKDIIPFKVATFSSGYQDNMHYVEKEFNENPKVNKSWDFYHFFSPNNGNKDGHSIRIASTELMKRHEKNKVLIVLSDGLPSAYASRTFGTADVRSAVREARKNGVKVISIAFGSESHRKSAIDIYKAMYQNSIISCEPDKITNELVKVFKREIIK